MSVPFLFTSAQMLGYWDGQRQHEIMPGHFYGLTWSTAQAWVSWQRSHVPESLIMAWDGEILELADLLNVHDILWDGFGLWITDTGHDQVICASWWDRGLKQAAYDLFGTAGVDTHHLNSLWGQPLVLESGLRGAAAGYPARVRDLHAHTIAEIGPYLCHNLYIERGMLYGCYKKGSVSGIYRMQLGGSPTLHPFPGNWFLRGMARGDGFFLFGRSVSVERSMRHDGHSAVLVTDNDLEVTEIVELRDTGQLRSVRLLNNDWAHNGLRFPFMEALNGL